MAKNKKKFENLEALMLDASLIEICGNGISGNGISGNGLSGNGLSDNGLSANGYCFSDGFNFEFDPNDFILEEEIEKTK